MIKSIEGKSHQIVDKKPDFTKRAVNDVSKVAVKSNIKPKTDGEFNTKPQNIKFGAKSGRKKAVTKAIDNIPIVSFITTEEFDSIPQYLIVFYLNEFRPQKQ